MTSLKPPEGSDRMVVGSELCEHPAVPYQWPWTGLLFWEAAGVVSGRRKGGKLSGEASDRPAPVFFE